MDKELLDVRGLQCPLPVMKAAKAMKSVATDGVLEVWATDPGVDEDMKVFCDSKGHVILERSLDDGVYRFVIQKGRG